MHMNCRSLYRKLDQISHLYNTYDIICCTETWLDDCHTVSMLNIPGMVNYRLDRQFKKGGGLCIYVSLKWSKYIKQIDALSYISNDIEVLTISLNKPTFRKFLISCVCRPPTGKSDTCHSNIKDIISYSVSNNYEMWILGDFNIDYLHRDKPDVKRYIATFKLYGMRQLISDITRPYKNSGTCIDWIITSSYFVALSGVCDHLISDHLPVFCTRKKTRERHSTVTIEARDFANYSRENMSNLLMNVDWNLFYSSTNPNVMYEFLLNHVYDLLSIMCPLRKFKQRETNVCWINKDIFKAIRTRKFYLSLFKITRRDDHLRLANIWRNNVNTMIDRAKAVYIKSQLERNVKNPRKFWRIIHSFLDNKKVEYGEIVFKDSNSDENIEKGGEAELLNNYFVNIATRLNLNSDMAFNVDNITHYNVLDTLHLDHIDVSIDELERLAKGIDITKASCIKNINSKICMDLLLILPNKFCHLFNTSLTYGIFPRLWATGYVNVIPKNGDLNDPGNWRPITQTNIFSKTLEKIVHKRLLE